MDMTSNRVLFRLFHVSVSHVQMTVTYWTPTPQYSISESAPEDLLERHLCRPSKKHEREQLVAARTRHRGKEVRHAPLALLRYDTPSTRR